VQTKSQTIFAIAVHVPSGEARQFSI
jgi:hypothetical protein